MVESQYQPSLISLQMPESEAVVELFPEVWQAAENLASGNVSIRKKSLESLLNSGAHRVSPLVAYVLATRLFDPNMTIRGKIISALADLMRRNEDGAYAAEGVRSQVITALSYFDDRGLLAVMEVGVSQPERITDVVKLVKYSPRAGKCLKEIAADREADEAMRRAAIQLLGQIGFVDALSELERLRNRIETRLGGQKRMPFAPTGSSSEVNLLPDLQKSILALQANQ